MMNLESRLEALEQNFNAGRPFIVWGNTKAELELKVASTKLPENRELIQVCWLNPVSPEEERNASHAKA